MINIKELRLGNLIECNRYVFTVENIHSPSEEFPLGSIQTMKFEAQRAIENVEPVELDNDILDNAGFKGMHLNKHLETFYVNTQSDYPFLITSDGDGKYFYGKVEIKYVHQLQNLYFFNSGFTELQFDRPLL